MEIRNKKILVFGGVIVALAILICVFIVKPWRNNSNHIDDIEITDSLMSTQNLSNWETNDKYSLKKIVILSRHGIRSPLSSGGSVLSEMTPNQWFKWSSDSSDLSLRGGILETIMGQFFRKYLVSKRLIKENWIPDNKDQVRFYANSLQRTIATSKYFLSGFLPVSNIDVEYHSQFGKMDPVFNPVLRFANDNLRNQAIKEILELFNKKDLNGILESLSDNFKILEKVLDFKNSKYAKDNNIDNLRGGNLDVAFEEGKEPAIKGILKQACSAADALVLQYYEEPDLKKAAFGKDINYDDWKKIAQIVDVYQKVLFSPYSVAINVANYLLKEMQSEINNNDRIVSYLCGHDSNVGSLLSSLEALPYSLNNSITPTVPTGSKVVFEKWIGPDNKEYMKVFLVYASDSQMRNCKLMDLDNPPYRTEIKLNGIKQNSDGFYSLDDILARLDKSINMYQEEENTKLAA